MKKNNLSRSYKKFKRKSPLKKIMLRLLFLYSLFQRQKSRKNQSNISTLRRVKTVKKVKKEVNIVQREVQREAPKEAPRESPGVPKEVQEGSKRKNQIEVKILMFHR